MSDEVTALVEESIRRTEDGDPGSGLALARRAMEVAGDGASRGVRAAARQALGEALYGLGDYQAAAIAAGEARTLTLAADPHGAGVGQAENLLGVAMLSRGESRAAVEVLRAAVGHLESARGPEDERTIQALNNLGGAQARAGDPAVGEATSRDALRRAERSLGVHRQTAVVLNSLSVRAGRDPARAAEALDLSERALDMARRSVGPHHPLTASLAANVAIHRLKAGDRSGVALLREAVTAHEAAFGPGHPNLASVLTALADATDDADEARRAVARAALIRLLALGPLAPPTLELVRKAVRRAAPSTPGETPSPEAQEIYRDWAALEPDAAPVRLPLAKQRTADEAAAGLERTFERWLGEIPLADELREELATDYAAADAAATSGDHAAAIGALEHALASIEATRGPMSTDLIEPLRRLDAVSRAGGDETPLLGLRRRVADITEAAWGIGHPLAAMAIIGYALWERHEYGTVSEPTAARARRAIRETLAEGRATRSAPRLFEAPPGRERRITPLSDARAADLRTIVAEGPLSGLAGIDWVSARHAYGPARDTPDELRLLRSSDPDVRADALERLSSSICHQGSVYSASALAVPFLARLVLEPGQLDREGIVWLLAMLAGGARRADTDPATGGAILGALAPFRESLLALAADAPGASEGLAELARALR